MISANDGCDLSMKAVQEGYKTSGFVRYKLTFLLLTKTTRAYGNSIDEMRSDDRDEAAAFLLQGGESKGQLTLSE
jgi:hypothetical protein